MISKRKSVKDKERNRKKKRTRRHVTVDSYRISSVAPHYLSFSDFSPLVQATCKHQAGMGKRSIRPTWTAGPGLTFLMHSG